MLVYSDLAKLIDSVITQKELSALLKSNDGGLLSILNKLNAKFPDMGVADINFIDDKKHLNTYTSLSLFKLMNNGINNHYYLNNLEYVSLKKLIGNVNAEKLTNYLSLDNVKYEKLLSLTQLSSFYKFNKSYKLKPDVYQSKEKSEQEQAYDPKLWVPREHTIKQKLDHFFATLNTTEDFQIQGYIGKDEPLLAPSVAPEEIKRRRVATELRDLSLFSNGIPDMNHGHVRNGKKKEVKRCLTISVKDKVVGAIYFSINLDTRTAYIRLLQVNEAFQKKHFGYFLLHSAIYIALMYGCTNTYLFPLKAAVPFYSKQGFDNSISAMALDLSKQDARQLFLKSIEKSAPASLVAIKECIERAQDKVLIAKPSVFLQKYKSVDKEKRKPKVTSFLRHVDKSPPIDSKMKNLKTLW